MDKKVVVEKPGRRGETVSDLLQLRVYRALQ